MSELIKLIKTNLSHQSLNHNVYRIDYDRVLDKYSIDGKPGIEFPFLDFVVKLRGFFKSEARFSTDQAMKARSPRIAELAKEKIESNRLYCIFDDDNNIASFCQISPSENRNYVYWVYLIYTPEEYRQQGLASDLIRFAENLAIQDRKTELDITVYNDNINALSLYKSLGFVEKKGGDMSEKSRDFGVHSEVSRLIENGEGFSPKALFKIKSTTDRMANKPHSNVSWNVNMYDQMRRATDKANDKRMAHQLDSTQNGNAEMIRMKAFNKNDAQNQTHEEKKFNNFRKNYNKANPENRFMGYKDFENQRSKEDIAQENNDMSQRGYRSRNMSEKPKQYEVVYETKEVPGSQLKRISRSLVPAGLGTLAAGIITEGDPACMAISGLGSGLLTYLANPHLSHRHYEQVPVLKEKDLSEGDKPWYKKPKYLVPLGAAGALYTIGRLS